MADRIFTRADFARFIQITTRWSDNDVYRHVNNVVYFSFFDTAVNQYLLEQGVLDFDHSPLVGLVVDNHCQFFRSVCFPDTVQVGICVEKIGNSSVVYRLGIFKNTEEGICALGQFTHVYVDRQTHRPQSIPQNIRVVLESLRL